MGLLVAPAFAPQSHAATTPVFRNNNVSGGSTLTGFHDVDVTTGSPAEVISSMPSSGTIPGSATLLSPWGGTGMTINTAGGSSKAKGGAGHTEGSNLAKITFPSGTGLDQTDPAPHDVGLSRYTIAFNFVWDLPGPGTLGPPMSGTFSVPLGVKVGTGPGASATFAWDVHWDAVVNGVTFTDVRSPYVGSQLFTGAGTYVTTKTAPASPFSPTSIAAGGGDDRLILRGAIRFEANNDDSRTVIEVLGSDLQQIDDELRASPGFLTQYLDPAHPEYRIDASSGFEEEVIPEPSAALMGGVAMTLLVARRRRRAAAGA